MTTIAPRRDRMQFAVKTSLVELEEELENMREDSVFATFMVQMAEDVRAAFKRGNKLLIFGNGGSAAQAQHLAAEFVGRYETARSGLPAIALTTDTSALTAIGNDYGYEYIFSRQIAAIGRAGDIALGISTSGNSENVCQALKTASTMPMGTYAFLGGRGGIAGKLPGVRSWAPYNAHRTSRIQEIHLAMCHILCDLIDRFEE